MDRYTDRPVSVDDTAWIVDLHGAEHVRPFVVTPSELDVHTALERGEMEQRIVLDGAGQRAGLWRAKLHDGWLVTLAAVISATPRRGAGRWALRRALQWAFEEHGVHRVWLEVTATNAIARTLYERHGFRWEGTGRDGFRTPDGTFENLCQYGMLASEYRAGDAERRRSERA